jgi:hypothetical protein
VNRRGLGLAALAAVVSLALPMTIAGQGRAGAPPTATARASAPFDLTGYWVSVISEDWRYRMVMPPKGDYRNVPITREALSLINAWNPAADDAAGNQCKAYGAGAIMRLPGRLHITWQDDNTLRLDTDAGTQTRIFPFAAEASARPSTPKPSWQGTSVARWERPAGRAGGPAPGAAQFGSLAVVTTNLRAGYLRRNGVPYSENARVTEHFDLAPQEGGNAWLVVTTIVDDPRYLTQPFIVSSHFKKEADASRWDPTPCSTTW